MKRAASKKIANPMRPAAEYKLLRKALEAHGLEVDTLRDDSGYLDAVFKFADMLLDIRSFCQE